MPTPGPQLLALGAWPEHVPEDMISGTLRRLVLHGARPLPGDEELRDRAARLLVEDRGAEALELLDTLPPTPHLALWTALADDARHDPVAARAALADVLRDRSGCTADLIQLLRTRPGLATAVRELAGPDVLPLLAQTWWTLGWHHRRDPPIRRLVLDALRGVEALAAAGPDQISAQRRLLALRGLLWDLGGERERALADLRIALEIPDQPDVADAETRADLHIHLARLLVATDPARALAHATAAMSVAPVPAAVRLRLGDLPELADRRDDPAWHALTMP